MIEINILEFIPQELRQQAQDTLVDFVSEQAKKFVSDSTAEKLKQLRSDGAFRRQFDKGLGKAIKRFSEEYYEKDEDLVEAISQEKDLFKSPDVKAALMTMLKSPSSYLVDEGETVAQSFDRVLPGRKNRERVNQAMKYLLRCLVEELWHLPELQPIYSLQFQKITAEAMRQQVELQKIQLNALTDVNDGIRQALLQLTDAISEKKLLPASSSPASVPSKVSHNLPNPSYTHFVGREQEIEAILAKLQPYPHSQVHLITIDGIGGIGKSALALEIAFLCLQNNASLPESERFDAIIWVSAKRTILTADSIITRHQVFRTLDDIYAAIAITLGKEGLTRSKPEEQAEIIRNALSSIRCLLIIDNLETVDDETVLSFLMELPAPTKAIITTRHRIDLAYPVRLLGMPERDAIYLINNECQARNIILTQEQIIQLVTRTGGVPLAIVWSIAQITAGHNIANVLRRLGQPTGDLARFCFEGVIDNIKSKAAFDVLLALSTFETDASREALGFTSDLPDLDRDDGLVVLEKLSLVNKSSDRFSMLPLTKDYSHSILLGDESKLNAIRNRQHQYYLDKLKDFSTSAEPRRFREFETNNVLSHIDWCISIDKTEDVPYLIRGVLTHLWAIGQWTICYKYSQIALELIRQSQAENRDMEAFLLFRIGRIDLMRGDNDVSEKRLLDAISIYKELNNISRVAHSASYLGILYINQKRYQESESVLTEVLKQARQVDDKKAVARIQNVIGQVYLEMEKYGLAEIAIMEAKNLLEDFRPSTGLAASYELLGRIKLLQNQPTEAVPYFNKCYEISKKIDVHWYSAFAKKWLAEALMKLNDYEGAVSIP